jgi:hypothetical protein
MRFRSLLTVLAIIGLVTPIAFAAETTGSISGIVKGRDGAPLPGVTVTVSGPFLPAGRTDYTDSAGRFQFARLLPGEYVVRASLEKLGSWQRNAVVAVGKDTQLDAILETRTTEAVEVSAALPLVDLKSTEVAQNFTREQFEKLPMGRSYKDLFQLAPGVASNLTNINVNAGGNREDNLFLYDGVNITNPFYADIVTNFTQHDIQEINIKQGAVTAEFGRTGGFVVNAITKSGTNDFHGEVGGDLQNKDFSAKFKNGTLGSLTDRYGVGAGLGGPILRDFVWFYASGGLSRATTGDRTNNFNVISGSSDPPTDLPDLKVDTDEYFGKLTSAPSPKLFFNASYRYRKATTENAGICSTCAPTVAEDDFTKNEVLTAGGTWFITQNAFAEVKYNRYREDNGFTPHTDFGYRPAFNAQRPDLMGQFVTVAAYLVGGTQVAGQTVGGTSLARNDDNFERDEVKTSVTYYASFWSAEHELKAGFGYDENGEDLDRVSNGWGDVRYQTSRNTCTLNGAIPDVPAPCFTAAYVSQQPAQESTGKLYGIFVQDRITIGSRLSVLLGLLANRDEYIAGASVAGPEVNLLTYDFGDELQPRVGVSYVVDTRARDKAYANYGRYYNTDNKALARNASPYRIFSTNARFDLNGNFIGEIPDPATTGKRLLPNIDPQYTDEFIVGYARPIAGVWSAELWGMYRRTKDMLDDFPTVDVDTANPKSYVYGNLTNARRRYRSLTLEINRAYANNWSANLSYTLSRLDGNWDLDSFGDSRNYNSSSLQDGPGFYVEDPNRDGILAGDRTHVLKLFGSYQVIRNATLGGYLRIQSGQPYEARGFGDYAGRFLYLERAGSRRTPTWTNFDLLASYAIPIQVVTVRLEGRLLNVFNSQPALTVDNRQLLVGQAVNPNFETPTSFATPRGFSLTAVISF